MPTLEVEANVLTDVKVTHVALVERGANRIPFKLIKRDNPMSIDLASIGRGLFKKAAPTPPTVICAVVRKGADLDVVKDRLAKAGLKVDELQEQEDSFLFPQDAASSGQDLVLKMDEDLALVVTNVAKGLASWSFAPSFTEVLQIEGFHPSVCMAFEVLRSTVWNILDASDSPESAAAQLGSAIGEFSAYVTALAGGIPVQAFKADVLKGEKPLELQTDDQVETAKADETGGTPEVAKGETVKADDAVAGEGTGVSLGHGDPAPAAKAEGAEVPAGADPAEAAQAAPAAKADESAAVSLTQEFFKAAFAELEAALGARLDAVAHDVHGLADRVAKTEEAVAGTVGGDAGGDPVSARKSGRRGPPPLLDTAMGRH